MCLEITYNRKTLLARWLCVFCPTVVSLAGISIKLTDCYLTGLLAYPLNIVVCEFLLANSLAVNSVNVKTHLNEYSG